MQLIVQHYYGFSLDHVGMIEGKGPFNRGETRVQRPLMRGAIATVVGLIAGSAFNLMVIEVNTSILFPMPMDLDPNDLEQFQGYIDSLPTLAFLVVMAAHLGQSFIGGWVAARLSPARPMIPAMVVGTLSLLGGLAMIQMLWGYAPPWMVIELPLYLVCSWAAGRLEVRRRERS